MSRDDVIALLRAFYVHRNVIYARSDALAQHVGMRTVRVELDEHISLLLDLADKRNELLAPQRRLAAGYCNALKDALAPAEEAYDLLAVYGLTSA